MPVGTTEGAFYEDEFHREAAKWDPKYDDNKSAMQNVIDNKTKDVPMDDDRDFISPIEIDSGEHKDKMMSPNELMLQNLGKDDPGNIYDDSGKIVDYKPNGWGTPDLPTVKVEPESYNLPMVDDRRDQSFMDMMKGYVGEQFTMDKFNAILKHPFMNSGEAQYLEQPEPPETPLGLDAGLGHLKNSDYDYDAWKKANPDAEMKPGQHYPDTYKLPNHMTFSDESVYSGKNGNEGGHWDKNVDDKWTFTPGKTNLLNHSVDEMKNYFKEVEPDSKLILPQERLPGYKGDFTIK